MTSQIATSKLDPESRDMAIEQCAWSIEEDFDPEVDNEAMIVQHIRELLEELK